ncbi:hydroxymethylpyrimidine/phosphomethylpyrimidine kinase [Treponema zuelzerae]|uniref:hydroxymethylpyrimidine kinase n=1 Tax=Teretinema zuelzerae TaxID=156 RepID=A0AAE3JMG4_9SPIR|nr:hydroxymethylpyrimidine/phosphomethylpyrimidine kinase [Teretinema zuelzerae]MCD1655694.1 hydroxymethylpyrimidine/phosphomethylpyrimidine kinase [Teretinema zuelzerae]
MRAALSIAGTDPTGGAGIFTDLRTFGEYGLRAMGCVTAVIAQNSRGATGPRQEQPCGDGKTTVEPGRDDEMPQACRQTTVEPGREDPLPAVRGCSGGAERSAGAIRACEGLSGAIACVEPAMLEAQLEAVYGEIAPDAVKIGLLPTPEAVKAAAGALARRGQKRIVVDPVLKASSGLVLTAPDTVRALIEFLFPLADLITPNMAELSILAGMTVRSKEDMEKAGIALAGKTGRAVLAKGGHLSGDCDDCLISGGTIRWFAGKRVFGGNERGTGCRLSSGICAELASGRDIAEAIARAKERLAAALSARL